MQLVTYTSRMVPRMLLLLMKVMSIAGVVVSIKGLGKIMCKSRYQ